MSERNLEKRINFGQGLKLVAPQTTKLHCIYCGQYIDPVNFFFCDHVKFVATDEGIEYQDDEFIPTAEKPENTEEYIERLANLKLPGFVVLMHIPTGPASLCSYFGLVLSTKT